MRSDPNPNRTQFVLPVNRPAKGDVRRHIRLHFEYVFLGFRKDFGMVFMKVIFL